MKFFVAVLALAAMALAEPEADPALFYSNYGYNYATPALAYNHAVSPYYAGRFAYANSYYNTFSPFYSGFYGYNRLFKRDAEAEADPALFYSNYGYNYAAPALAYSHAVSPFYANRFAYAHSYYNAYNPFYNNYFGYSRLFKRDADAEADPAVLYGAYGYNYAAPLAYSYNHRAYAFPYYNAYRAPFAYRNFYGRYYY